MLQKEEIVFQQAAVFVIGAWSPFLVVLFCCFLIFSPLGRHAFQMSGEGCCFSSPYREALFKAVGTVLSLLLPYFTFHVANIILMSQIPKTSPIILYVCFDVLMVYSPIQTVILVLVNPKQPVVQMLLRTKCLCNSATWIQGNILQKEAPTNSFFLWYKMVYFSALNGMSTSEMPPLS